MAKIKHNPAFTGSPGTVSAYTMQGVEGIVLRRKGGPSKEQINLLQGLSVPAKIILNFQVAQGRLRILKTVYGPLNM